jgi:hypothetical protein
MEELILNLLSILSLGSLDNRLALALRKSWLIPYCLSIELAPFIWQSVRTLPVSTTTNSSLTLFGGTSGVDGN